jgi:hypothetical protein
MALGNCLDSLAPALSVQCSDPRPLRDNSLLPLGNERLGAENHFLLAVFACGLKSRGTCATRKDTTGTGRPPQDLQRSTLTMRAASSFHTLHQRAKSSARKRRVCVEPQFRHWKVCSSSSPVVSTASSDIRFRQSGHRSDGDRRRRSSLVWTNKSIRSTNAVLAAKSIHLDSIAWQNFSHYFSNGCRGAFTRVRRPCKVKTNSGTLFLSG